MEYHQPVLLDASIEALAIKPDGIYVDVTFGGGGHSKAILAQLGNKGKLFAFDQDVSAKENTFEDERFVFIESNFQHLKRFLKLHSVGKVDGILADLGVSSHQFDVAERGFSYRYSGPLDMRMNQNQSLTAAQILNQYEADALQQLFSTYGEIRNAKTLATRIVDYRSKYPLINTSDLCNIIDPLVKGQRHKYLAQVFQAVRIEVNKELEALKAFLNDTLEVLDVKGRLVVIAYHSLEDRVVKNFMKTGNADGNVSKDFFGNIFRPFRILEKKAVLPSDAEIQQNPRSRSAKMRVAEKN